MFHSGFCAQRYVYRAFFYELLWCFNISQLIVSLQYLCCVSHYITQELCMITINIFRWMKNIKLVRSSMEWHFKFWKKALKREKTNFRLYKFRFFWFSDFWSQKLFLIKKSWKFSFFFSPSSASSQHNPDKLSNIFSRSLLSCSLPHCICTSPLLQLFTISCFLFWVFLMLRFYAPMHAISHLINCSFLSCRLPRTLETSFCFLCGLIPLIHLFVPSKS